MKKIVVSVILSILAMDFTGFAPQASAVVIVRRPIIRERVRCSTCKKSYCSWSYSSCARYSCSSRTQSCLL